MESDVLLFVEPRLSAEDTLLLHPFEVIRRVNVAQSRRESYGLIAFAKKAMSFVEQGYWEDQYAERVHTEISAIGNSLMTVVFLYKSPVYPVVLFLELFEKVLTDLVDRHVVIVGDFNIREDRQRQSLLDLCSRFNLRMVLQSNVTTEANTMIDYCFTNIEFVVANVLESKAKSYHFPIRVAIPRYYAEIPNGEFLSCFTI